MGARHLRQSLSVHWLNADRQCKRNFRDYTQHGIPTSLLVRKCSSSKAHSYEAERGWEDCLQETAIPSTREPPGALFEVCPLWGLAFTTVLRAVQERVGCAATVHFQVLPAYGVKPSVKPGPCFPSLVNSLWGSPHLGNTPWAQLGKRRHCNRSGTNSCLQRLLDPHLLFPTSI